MDKPSKAVKKQLRRTCTPEFKADVVRICKAGDRSFAFLAQDLDIDETTPARVGSSRRH